MWYNCPSYLAKRRRRILTQRDVYKRNEFLVPKRLSRNAEKYWIKWESKLEYLKKKWLFCSWSDNNVWRCNVWTIQDDWTIKWEKTDTYLKKNCWFCTLKKEKIILLSIRQKCLEMLCVTRTIKWEKTSSKTKLFSIRLLILQTTMFGDAICDTNS